MMLPVIATYVQLRSIKCSSTTAYTVTRTPVVPGRWSPKSWRVDLWVCGLRRDLTALLCPAVDVYNCGNVLVRHFVYS